ncbi:SCO family protein [Calidifontibacillus oryziterrae]|uniref:SCO family protein n=1 Tax=Calidifontibacillus oryziterrae TaxID=1191699 RepID=UPI000304EB14|nr:SCO family protein [Calidifontibacillus oryziterrae]
MRSKISILLVLITGLFVMWIGTDGLQAFTAEKARRVHITENMPTLPSVSFEDSNGNIFQIDDFKDKIVLATFIYTSCGDVCPIIEMKFKEVYDSIPKEHLGKDIVFISFSFDQIRDTPEKLKHYGIHFGVDEVTWKMARFKDIEDQQSFLDLIGVIVIPTENGGFEHNSAIYMINENGQLVDIFDYQYPDKIINKVNSIVETT